VNWDRLRPWWPAGTQARDDQGPSSGFRAPGRIGSPGRMRPA
jgi:hypothetical protein